MFIGNHIKHPGGFNLIFIILIFPTGREILDVVWVQLSLQINCKKIHLLLWTTEILFLNNIRMVLALLWNESWRSFFRARAGGVTVIFIGADLRRVVVHLGFILWKGFLFGFKEFQVYAELVGVGLCSNINFFKLSWPKCAFRKLWDISFNLIFLVLTQDALLLRFQDTEQRLKAFITLTGVH